MAGVSKRSRRDRSGIPSIFPSNQGNGHFRDDFARDCLLQRRVQRTTVREPQTTTSAPTRCRSSQGALTVLHATAGGRKGPSNGYRDIAAPSSIRGSSSITVGSSSPPVMACWSNSQCREGCALSRSRDDTALAVEGIVDSGMHAQEAGGSNAQGLIDKPAGVTAEPANKGLTEYV